MKQSYKYYLDDELQRKLIAKAEARGFIGRGSLSRFIELIAREEFIFINSDSKVLLNLLNLSIGLKSK